MLTTILIIIGVALVIVLFLLLDKKHLTELKEFFAKKIPIIVPPPLTSEQVTIIKNDIKLVEDRLTADYEKNEKISRDRVYKANSICPKCNSKKLMTEYRDFRVK